MNFDCQIIESVKCFFLLRYVLLHEISNIIDHVLFFNGKNYLRWIGHGLNQRNFKIKMFAFY
jgi:hypothetical protein